MAEIVKNLFPRLPAHNGARRALGRCIRARASLRLADSVTY